MELLVFIADNVLGPVFDHDLAMVRAAGGQCAGAPQLAAANQNQSEREVSSGERPAVASSKPSSSRASRSRRKAEQLQTKTTKTTTTTTSRASNAGDAILDLSGPRLIEGLRIWIYFYMLMGQINLANAPLYLALLYRLAVCGLSNYIIQTHFVVPLFHTQVLNLNYANPIFILITFLALTLGFLNNLIIFYTGTFNLCPLFKILKTPKLCFVNRHTQNALGAYTLKYMLVFLIYHTLLYRMLLHETFGQFVSNFSLFEFLAEYFAVTVQTYALVGLGHVDFYVRSCFGAWLLALKTNLECRHARLSYLRLLSQQQQQRQQRQLSETSSSGNNDERENFRDGHAPSRSADTRRRKSVMSQFRDSYMFVSLDEIQKSLNTMDDHLEVTRTIQTFSLVLISLLAFVTSGSLFLVAYNALAKKANYYHGAAFILLALNFAFLVMLTYLGDSFIFYALGKLIQTVEDEYFLQGDSPGPGGAGAGAGGSRPPTSAGCDRNSSGAPLVENQQRQRQAGDHLCERATGSVIATHDWLQQQQQQQQPERANEPQAAASLTNGAGEDPSEQTLLSIKRSDVLFCRELLEQFENHLATPWSKLTFKSHLNIIATFATLIAAQIIFDSH